MSHVILVNGKMLTERGISVKDAMRLADTHCKVRFGQRVDWTFTLEEAKEQNANMGDIALTDGKNITVVVDSE
jgi:hypothetical protein